MEVIECRFRLTGLCSR